MWHHVGNPLRCVLFGVYIEILRLFFLGRNEMFIFGIFFFSGEKAQRKMHFWDFLRAELCPILPLDYLYALFSKSAA